MVRDLLIDKFDRTTVDVAMGWLEGSWPPFGSPKLSDEVIGAVKAEATRLDGLTVADLQAEYEPYLDRRKVEAEGKLW